MATQRPNSLVDPDQPGAGPEVLIYDGQCRFCQGQVERLARWDTRRLLSFLSLHDPRVTARYPDLTYEGLMEAMVLIDRRGRRHRGAEVIQYLSRQMPRLWWLVPLLHMPGSLPVWQGLYRLVARQRYRWGKLDDCDSGQCAIHWGERPARGAKQPVSSPSENGSPSAANGSDASRG